MIRDGGYYALAFGLLAAACGILIGPWAAVPGAALAAFCLYFFRDPERTVPLGHVCVSPADGKVVQLRREPDGRMRISIFLSIFDVHVNRMPISGRVRSVRYSRGSFHLAHLDSASVENEQNMLVIDDAGGDGAVEVRQIAGLIARRIVCRRKEGDFVHKGERFGLIKFGSRVDILLGDEWDIAVRLGDKVSGGATILASRKMRGLE